MAARNRNKFHYRVVDFPEIDAIISAMAARCAESVASVERSREAIAEVRRTIEETRELLVSPGRLAVSRLNPRR